MPIDQSCGSSKLKTRLRNLLMMINDVTKCLRAHCVKTAVATVSFLRRLFIAVTLLLGKVVHQNGGEACCDVTCNRSIYISVELISVWAKDHGAP